MGVQITDCTIRDGGYLLNKNSDPKFVRGIMKGLADAGIDFVESGFLQTKVNGETIVYHNAAEATRHFPDDVKNTEFIGFCDNSRYSPDHLEPYSGKSFKWMRISFGKHEIDGAVSFCQKAQEKGYTVQFNPMDAISYSADEWESLVSKVNTILPGSFSIVDTFGAMHLSDLANIFKRTDKKLDKSVKIGLHAHNNLGLASALAETMVMLSQETGRDVIVDGSLYGMGRGAGNASTELVADYVNKNCGGGYDIATLLDTIDTFIIPITGSVKWGYDLPMYICGTEHAHVDNVYHLMERYGCGVKDMYAVMKSLDPADRTRYGSNYSKNDFTALDKAYSRYCGEGNR